MERRDQTCNPIELSNKSEPTDRAVALANPLEQVLDLQGRIHDGVFANVEIRRLGTVDLQHPEQPLLAITPDQIKPLLRKSSGNIADINQQIQIRKNPNRKWGGNGKSNIIRKKPIAPGSLHCRIPHHTQRPSATTGARKLERSVAKPNEEMRRKGIEESITARVS